MLLLEPPYYLEDRKKEWLRFVMRWQQFTGPVMAKGLEDTATYRHNSLLSLNEVGGDPLRERPPFDLEEFHEFNRRRLEEWPDTLNATATHDTKRGEDVARAAERAERNSRRMGAAAGALDGVECCEQKEAVNGVLAPIGIGGDPDLPDAAGRVADRGGGAAFRAGAGVPGQGAARGQAEQQLDRAARRITSRRCWSSWSGFCDEDSRFLAGHARVAEAAGAAMAREQPGAGASEDRRRRECRISTRERNSGS